MLKSNIPIIPSQSKSPTLALGQEVGLGDGVLEAIRVEVGVGIGEGVLVGVGVGIGDIVGDEVGMGVMVIVPLAEGWGAIGAGVGKGALSVGSTSKSIF